MRRPTALFALALAGCGPDVLRLPSDSMAPTMPAGTLVVVEPVEDARAEVARGAVVIHEHLGTEPVGAPGDRYVKRVVALEADTLRLRGRTLTVNGAVVAEPYASYAPPPDLAGPLSEGTGDIAGVVVPAGTVFVLGDNRHNAIDSRYHGPVPYGAIRGRVTDVLSRGEGL